MYNQFGVKELYEISLKATDNMTINGQNYEKDEVVMFFENLQIAAIIPDSSISESSGGKNDFGLIMWEKIKGIDFVFEDGLVNLSGFNFLTQSKMFNSGVSAITIPRRESVITDSSGIATLDYTPSILRSMFAYKLVGDIIQSKLTIVSVNAKTMDLGIANKNTTVLIDYYYSDDNISIYEIGGENITGFLKMTSKINMIDKKDGTKTTMLFVMPKVRIMSNINLTIGAKANPIVSTFRLRAFPAEDGKTLARFIYLNEDIEG